ncbi:MAG: AAA family ATPase [Bacilli bacterium]|nr:AAA family ATPase [Bacilli bacterium]
MKINKMHIRNYRQFQNEAINFEGNITVLAGANNSGKTSIVELFDKLFSITGAGFKREDIPIEIANRWKDIIANELSYVFSMSPNKEIFIENLSERLLPEDSEIVRDNNNEIELPIAESIVKDSIFIDFEVGYQKNDNISKFADYLMDLSDNVYGFFFRCLYCFQFNQFFEKIEDKYEQLAFRIKLIEKEKNIEKKNIKVKNFMAIIEECYYSAFISKYYYADKEYKNLFEIEDIKKFKALFNYKHIKANRTVDDEGTDKGKFISKATVEYLKSENEWKKLSKNLPDKIIEPLQTEKIPQRVKKESLNLLSNVINEINNTNGGTTLEINLDLDITDDAVKTLIQNVANAKYIVDGQVMPEASQGLGYSHMIYMHLQLEEYRKNINPYLVNFYIIEEPEAHMHPQMQRVFMLYLFEYYKGKKLQGMVTTHSSEIIKETKMDRIRVIRNCIIRKFSKNIYDINAFLKTIPVKRKKECENFFNVFFRINFSQIIFADKVVLYEGDTERMYLQSIIQNYDKLKKQYIAYVQIGGAYAHWYKEILEFLKIKALVITDIDYDKRLTNPIKIKKSKTSNGGIMSFYKESHGGIQPKNIEDLYIWHKMKRNDLIYISYQTEEDAYARTLEEAMLAKLYSIKISDELDKKVWRKMKKDKNLDFVVPNITKKSIKKTSNIREILESTSDKKTDFMYSVLLNKLEWDMLPKYIKEGLKWLAN